MEMESSSHDVKFLRKGEYLAPKYKTYDFHNHLIGVTKYANPIRTGEWHKHEKHILSYVLVGSNHEYRKGKYIKRSDGSLTFYRPHELHKNCYSHFPSVHISIELEYSFMKKYDYSEKDIEKAVINNHGSRLSFLNLLSEAAMKDNLSGDSTAMIFIDFIEKSRNVKFDSSMPLFMYKVKEHLNDNWNSFPSLAYLSDQVEAHPTTISKYFRAYFNCNLGEYMRILKIENALDMIKNTKNSLTEISLLCGFSDQSHFIRVFKAKTGYLPKQFQSLVR